MFGRYWTLGLVGLFFAGALGCQGPASQEETPRAAPAAAEAQEPLPDPIDVGVEGRSNQTPYLAARGDDVALVWSASVDGATDLFLATSSDAGRTFSAPRRVNDVDGDVNVYGEQPPRVALGDNGEVYVAWTVRDAEKRGYLKLARSTDGGESFEPSMALHEAGLGGSRGWQSLAVAPDGRLHAVWLDARPPEMAGHHAALGNPLWSLVETTAHAHETRHPMGLYHISWSGEAAPSDTRLFEPVCECCKTAMAIGPDGAIYAAWRHIYPDNYRDISVTVSRDGGDSFSEAARVYEDGWQINGCPDDGPAMVVDRDNVMHLVWPSLVHEETDMGVFYSSTSDGQGFSQRTRLRAFSGTDPSHPQMAIDGSGEMVVVWDESIEGKRRIVVTRESGDASWRAPELADAGEPEVSHTYPVVAAAGSGAILAWTRQSGDASVIRVSYLE